MMLWLLAAETAKGEATGEKAHHVPAIVELVNRYIGEPVHHFQVTYTKPLWDRVLANFGTSAEKVFGPYTPENAVPWYTVMFIIACLLCLAVVFFLRRRLSVEDPDAKQQILEMGIASIRNLLLDNVGSHGMKYFPVIATFAVLILISNLMALVPGLMPPTASMSVTFALGLSSFIYYNYVGISENGLFGHLRHFAGPMLLLAPLLFPIEIISNMVRPLSLSVRLFGNMFGDEQIAVNIANIWPPVTYLLSVILYPLTAFVAFVQTFIFVLLSIIYISEVTHAPHEEHKEEPGGIITLPNSLEAGGGH